MDRKEEAEKNLKYWQSKLNLFDWNLAIKMKKFTRTDYVQTGDFKVVGDKRAIIYISEKPTDKDIRKVVLHELIHVLLWKLDNYCENQISAENKSEYLGLLEETVDTLTKRFASKKQ